MGRHLMGGERRGAGFPDLLRLLPADRLGLYERNHLRRRQLLRVLNS